MTGFDTTLIGIWMLVGLLGAVLGCRHSYGRAINEAQRRHYRRLFSGAAPAMLAFFIVAWLASAGMLPAWMFWGAIGIWFAVAIPVLAWSSRRLADLAKPDPYVALVDGARSHFSPLDAR